MKNATVSYRRINHAAHYSHAHPSRGHDLEEWTVATLKLHAASAAVPIDAEYHHGFVDGGCQHWVFVRVAPMAGTCAGCERREGGA